MEAAISQLEDKLKQGQGHFTLNEASAVTGISVDNAKDALNELIQKYICRLQVTENGDLIYDFGKKPRRRGRISFGEIMAYLGNIFWNVFMFVFKIWIAFTLVFYFSISIFIIIALLVFFISSNLSSSSRSGRSSSSRAGTGSSNGMITGLSSSIFRMILEIFLQVSGSVSRIFISLFRWKTSSNETLEHQDSHGYKYKKYKANAGIINPQKKNFVASVYDFVFGPKRVDIDPLNNEKEVAAYLKEQKGILVLAELIALAGWTMNQAREFFTDCLTRFQGEVHVSENGVMFGEFNQLMRGVGKAETGKIIWYWDEYEPEYEITGNTAARDIWVSLMNFVNMIVSFELIRFFGVIIDTVGKNSGVIVYNILGLFPINITQDFLSLFDPESALFFYKYLGLVPLIFSILFFIIPLIRAIRYNKANKNRVHRNMQKRIFKAIYSVKGQPLTLEQYLTLVNRNAQEDAIDKEIMESMLKDIALDLGGDMDIAENGEILYTFQRINHELETKKILREKKKTEAALGNIIADSQ